MLNDEGLAALRALRDCGAIAARWDHPGYRQLMDLRLAALRMSKDPVLMIFTLNKRGIEAAWRFTRKGML